MATLKSRAAFLAVEMAAAARNAAAGGSMTAMLHVRRLQLLPLLLLLALGQPARVRAQLGVPTGNLCAALGNCNGHGRCNSLSKTCACFEGYGAAADVALYKAPDCSLRALALCLAGSIEFRLMTIGADDRGCRHVSGRAVLERTALGRQHGARQGRVLWRRRLRSLQRPVQVLHGLRGLCVPAECVEAVMEGWCGRRAHHRVK